MVSRPLSRIESDNLIKDPHAGMERLLEIMARLRAPDGCPWDLEQNFATIAPYTLEEAYEVQDAIEQENWDHLKEELGDLLLQTVYHAQLAQDAGLFSFEDIIPLICDKMIRRHPHVFGPDAAQKTAAQQRDDWEKTKQAERASKSERRTLDGIARALPGLTRAVKLQNRAADVGFDWPDIGPVLDKIAEETQELTEAMAQGNHDHIAEEYGDLLFVMANLGRHLKLDPETALRAANAKFTRRFEQIETWLADHGKRPKDSNLQEMDALWNRAKEYEKLCQGNGTDSPARTGDPQIHNLVL